jgi:hypothetical protein
MCYDLTIQQILPYINGFNHVVKIACLSEVDITLVKECVQHLVAYGFLKLISIFQYCNVYVTKPEVRLLLTDQQLSRECLDYVALQGMTIQSCPQSLHLRGGGLVVLKQSLVITTHQSRVCP